MTPLREIDEDILRLVVRRSRLLAKMPENSSRERELRTHWEEAAAKVSRDPRLIRQLFALLQEVDIAAEDLTLGAFNLAPSSAPIKATLRLPGSDRQTRRYAALAAASGEAVELRGVLLNTATIEAVKIFNQAGANLRWEEFPAPVIHATRTNGFAGPSATGSLRPVMDKVIHAGDDPLNLYLAIFLLATRPSRLKLLGESSLRFLDLSAVRHFLPALGCRMSNIVPGQDGLPARLESSALLPHKVVVPAELPDDAVTALLLSTAFWDAPVTIDLSAHPRATALLDEAESVLRFCECSCIRRDLAFSVTPSHLRFPRELHADMCLPLAFALLAMPGLTGGKVTLQGTWPVSDPLAAPLIALLEGSVELAIGSDTVSSTRRSTPATPRDFSALPPELLGPALALFVHDVVARKAKPELPELPRQTDMALVDDFLHRLGLVRNERRLEAVPEEGKTPWAAPDLWWGLGFVLGSFSRRNLRLSNPSCISAVLPSFWTLFNSLPAPTMDRPAPDTSEVQQKPVRRRIHSSEFLAAKDLPPALNELEDN